METNGVWRSFVETGDPICYLLAKKMERQPRENGKPRQKKTGSGDRPRPTD